MAKRLAKTTTKQYEVLLDFIKSNRVILTGKTNILEQKKINNLWQTFAAHINSLGIGPAKSCEQWRHVFNEWKTNTRRKSREIAKHQQGTGGGPQIPKKLTDLEEQLLSLLSKIHLGDPEVGDSLDYQGYTSNSASKMNMKSEPKLNESFSADINFSNEDFNASQSAEEIIYLDIQTDDNIQPNENTNTNIPEPEPVQKENTPPTTTQKKKIRDNKMKKSSTARNILLEATQNYERAMMINLESENKKMEATLAIARSLEEFTTAYRLNSVGSLKLEYYKIFNTFDGFDEVYKDLK